MLKRFASQLCVLAILAGTLAWGLAACNKNPEKPASTPAATTQAPQGGGAVQTAAATPAPTPTPAIDLSFKPCPKVNAPSAPAIDDPNVLGYFRLREPNKTLDRVAAWATLTNPQITAATFRQQLQAMNVDLSQLRAGGNVAVVFWKPSNPMAKPSWAAIVPIKAGSPLAAMLTAMLGGAQSGALGDDLLLAADQATYQAASAKSALFGSLANDAMTVDLQANLNVEAVTAQYGAMARNQVAMLAGILGQAGLRGNPNAQQQAQLQMAQRMLQAEAAAALDGLDQVKTDVLNVNLDPAAAEFSSVVTAKAATTFETLLKNDPEQSPDLAKFIDGNNKIVGQWTIKTPGVLVDIYEKYLPQIFPAGQQAQVDKLKQLMEKWKQIGPVTSAMGFDFLKGKGMSMEVVVLSDNPDLIRKLGLEQMKESLSLSESIAGGVKLEPAIAENVRQVHGQPVDRVTVKITLPANMSNDQKKAFDAMYGGNATMTAESMTLGKLRLMAMNHPVDALADRVASGAPVKEWASSTAFEPGATATGEIDVLSYAKLVMDAMPGATATGLALANAKASPVLAAAYQQGGIGYYRLRVPSDLVAAGARLTQATQQEQAARRQQREAQRNPAISPNAGQKPAQGAQ